MYFSLLFREGQLVVIIFHAFFSNNILILFPNLLSYREQGNIIFIIEFVIQGLSFGIRLATFFASLLPSFLQTFHSLQFSVITSFMELSHQHVCFLHLPFFDQPKAFSVAKELSKTFKNMSICHQIYQDYLSCNPQEDCLKIRHIPLSY